MAAKSIITHTLGYPRIGAKRELKKATEAYWSGRSNRDELIESARRLRAENWRKQAKSGIDLIASNDFSFYDQMLDTLCMTGAIPERFGWTACERGSRSKRSPVASPRNGFCPSESSMAATSGKTNTPFPSKRSGGFANSAIPAP